MLELHGSLDRPRIRPDVATEVGCHVDVRPAGDLAGPLASHVCLVFDCSGSMAGAKAEAAIAAAHRIVDTIDARHRISLVGFATSHWVLVDNACVAETGREPIRAQIDRLRNFIRGGTNLSEGIRRGIQVVQRQQADANVLVVLSDGEADSPFDAVQAGREASHAGIQVFAVGIGEDFKADDLLQIVRPSNGAVLGERDAAKLEAAFAVLLQRIESFVATNAQLEIALAQGVHPSAVYKTSPERMFVTGLGAGDRTIRIHVGNIERAQAYGFVIALTPPAGKPGAFELARVTLRYDLPNRRRDQRAETAVIVIYDERAEAVNAEAARAQRRAQVAALVDELAAAERRGDRLTSAQLLDELRRRSDHDGDPRVVSALRGLTPPIPQADLNTLVLAATARDATPPPVPWRAPTLPPRADTAPPPPPPPREAAPPPPPPLPPAERDVPLHDVVLVDPGPSVIELMREIREHTGLGLAQVHEIIKAAPATIIALPHADATALKRRLEAAGAHVDVKT